jgi:hypothetical protein
MCEFWENRTKFKKFNMKLHETSVHDCSKILKILTKIGKHDIFLNNLIKTMTTENPLRFLEISETIQNIMN